MKKTIFILVVILVVCSQLAFAIDIKNIIAYPVPFNPKKSVQYITINNPSNTPTGNFKIKVQVYDVNGDKVFYRDYTSFPIRWNGRNNSGLLAKPGFYIIKLEVEDSDTGGYNKKIIRILIRY